MSKNISLDEIKQFWPDKAPDINIGQMPIIINPGGSHGIRPNKLNKEVGSCADKSFIQPKNG